jgi:MoxR-like ATPase
MAKPTEVELAAGMLAQALAATQGKMPQDVEARLARLETRAPAEHTIVLQAATETKVDVGATHEAFEKTLRWVNRRRHIWLAGPTGSGKTTMAEQVAKALNLPFYYSGALWDAYGLSGFKSATGDYVRTLFREAYENGGVFLLDEVDACEPAAILWLNGALANGVCPFPDAMVKRHKDFVCICAANTWGQGATTEYVGRMKQDSAFLDRFIAIEVNYDPKLERALAQNDAWFNRIQEIRGKIKAKGLRVIVSPRATLMGAQALADGQAWREVEQEVLASKMTPDQWASIR